MSASLPQFAPAKPAIAGAMAEADRRWDLSWDHGRAEIFAIGASLHNLEFELEDGATVRPLAEAPWQSDGEVMANENIPAHLRRLGGEWPCIPFGTTAVDPDHHGRGANHCWQVTRREARSISLAIDYPCNHPVERLERCVKGVEGTASVEIELVVKARRHCRLPVGLHPIFRLPENGRLHLVGGERIVGHTFPGTFEPGISQLRQAAYFDGLDRVPLAGEGSANLTVLPNGLREEILQIEGVSGSIRLAYPADGYAVRLEWNPQDFPSLILWLSDRGRTGQPWSGQFRGVGIEPVCAFFDDAGLAAGAPEGIATGRELAEGELWRTRYRISAEKFQEPAT